MTALQSSPAIPIDVLVEDYPMPVFLLSSQAIHIEWVNQSGQEWLGKSSRKIVGENLSTFIDNIQPCMSAYKRCKDTNSHVILRDFNLERKNGARQKCHLLFFPSEIGVGLSVLTPQSRSSKRPSQGQTLTAMGRMLAHEIKNPLAGISGAAQLLKDDVKTEEGRSLLELIRSEIGRISRLADRMERLGDTNSREFTDINIHEILRNARKVIQSSVDSSIAFTESYDPSLPFAKGDADALMQALLNLIKNAAESIAQSGKNGEIRLETKFRSGVRRQQENYQILSSGKNQFKQLPIEIRIIDDGPGIADNIRETVFQPFVSSKPSGQGLGLALVSKIAQAHGGLIDVQSNKERTIFSILLPASDESDV